MQIDHPNSNVQSAEKSAVILLVDDEPANLSVLNTFLQPHFKIRVARSGEEALRVAKILPCPDLILLDVMMPMMDGYTVLKELKKSPDSQNIPVIFVTAMDNSHNETYGLELGAVDYITKPIVGAVVLARVRTHLELKAVRENLVSRNLHLDALVNERTVHLKKALESAREANSAVKKSYFDTLMAIGSITDLRHHSIGSHSRRVAVISRQVAMMFALSETEIENIFISALLHDIGRIGFSDELLNKPVNTMKIDELSAYRKHPTLAADALNKIDSLAGIATNIRHHHERYDGTGFPDGLSGLNIPLGARIISAISDYDELKYGNLTNKPMSIKEIHQKLKDGKNHRYDPDVVDAMESVIFNDDTQEIDEIHIKAGHLQEGMVLSRDVYHPDGYLLLSKNTVLGIKVIEQIFSVEKNSLRSIEIYVLRNRIIQFNSQDQ